MAKSLDILKNLDKKYAKIHLFLNQEELFKITEISRSQQISRSRLFGLDIDVETRLRNLNRDTIETNGDTQAYSLMKIN